MNEQPTKRRNPFDVPKNIVETEEEVVVEQEQQPIVSQPIQQPQASVQYYTDPEPVYPYREQPRQQQPKVTRQQPRQQYAPAADNSKDKYTATMDYMLRRSIKIYCATNGIMFSEFIEIACRDKLKREGVIK